MQADNPKALKHLPNIRKMGSDCVHCSLEEGVICMIYFCKKRSTRQKREICADGFVGKCTDYKPLKNIKRYKHKLFKKHSKKYLKMRSQKRISKHSGK